MKKVAFILLLLALTLFLVTVVSAAPLVHQVSGRGRLNLEDGFETLVFNVTIDSEGVVEGQGDFHKDIGVFAWSSRWVPNCLSVDGNIAWIGFTTIRTSYPNLPPEWLETTMQLQVTDRGTRISPAVPTAWLPRLGLGSDCNDQADFFSLDHPFFPPSHVWQIGEFRIR